MPVSTPQLLLVAVILLFTLGTKHTALILCQNVFLRLAEASNSPQINFKLDSAQSRTVGFDHIRLLEEPNQQESSQPQIILLTVQCVGLF